MNATQLAQHLGVSKARVSQYVAEGLLAGCYEGEGRNRRFDPDRCRAALRKGLDPGQMLGNGAKTLQTLKASPLWSEMRPAHSAPPKPQVVDGALSPDDLDRYELAKIEIAEQDARRKRRDNLRDEECWILATEVSRQVAKIVGQEVAEFEMVLRDGARAVADQLGVDFKAVRKILIDQWREHRGQRADVLDAHAGEAVMSDEEKEADV